MSGKESSESRREYKARYYKERKSANSDSKYAPLLPITIDVIDNFQSDDGQWGKCKTVGLTQYRSFSYEAWKRMNLRCKEGSAYQKASPSYCGCTVHPDFVDFQKFTEWHMRQVGFGLEGYHIDKDILILGNREYGPDACALVPAALNAFFTVKKPRGLPAGVRIDPRNGRYRVEMKIENVQTYIGRFDTEQEAMRASMDAKKAEALHWAARLRAGEFIVDPRVIAVLENWSR